MTRITIETPAITTFNYTNHVKEEIMRQVGAALDRKFRDNSNVTIEEDENVD